MAALEAETAANDRLSLWIAFDYGGRAELVEAARRLLESGSPPGRGRGRARAQLYAPELPDPDLLIRTSGELRLSNFLLWQLAYAELVFVETLWPDFGEDDLRRALADYAGGAGGSAAMTADEQLRLARARHRGRRPGRPLPRLPRRLVALRPRRVRRARRPARALRDGARRCGRSSSPATRARSRRCSAPQLGGPRG